MNRRAFLGLLGGAITAVAAKPVLALVPAPAAPAPVWHGAYPITMVKQYLSMDEVNAFAFAFHGEVFPEHKDHYRAKAMHVMAKMRRAQR